MDYSPPGSSVHGILRQEYWSGLPCPPPGWVCYIWPLLCWSMFPLYLLCLVYHKLMLNFVKTFFCICWDIYMIFILQCVSVVYHVDWFVGIELSLHSWDKSHLIVVCGLLMYCWIWFASIFTSVFISDIGLKFYLWCVWFLCQADAGLIEWVQNVPSSLTS